MDRWLDVGCYDGTILRAFTVPEKIGLDLDIKKQRDIQLIQATGEYLPFKEKSLNIITAFDVLEHIQLDFQMINQIKNKLTKNGLFILTSPHEKEKIFPKFLNNWLIYTKWKHIRTGYTSQTLKVLFKGHWKLKIIHWNTDLSNFLYFPLQFIWKTLQRFAKVIINIVIRIEFIRTKKYFPTSGHIIVIAKKQDILDD